MQLIYNWFWLNFKVWQLVIIDRESLEGGCVHNYWAAEKLLSLPWHFLPPLLGAKLTFWKRISLDPLIHFWLQVAKMLKEIPRGSTFVIRLVEPLKAGFGNFLSFLLVFRPLSSYFSFFWDFFTPAPCNACSELTSLREGPAGMAEVPPERKVKSNKRRKSSPTKSLKLRA